MDHSIDYGTAVRIVHEFLRTHPEIAATKVKRAYGIDNGRYRKQLARELAISTEGKSTSIDAKSARGRQASANTVTRQRFISFARDIQDTPDEVLHRLRRGQPSLPPSMSDPQILLRAAHLLAQTQLTQSAVDNAEIAFVLAASRSADEAIRVLPDTLYYANRCGSTERLAAIIRTRILPAIDAFGRKPLSERHVSAALGQLGCALNEGGRYSEAAELFTRSGVQKVIKDTSDLQWCGLSIAGNQAFGWTPSEGAVRRSQERLEDLRIRYRMRVNQRSLANTLCRLHLTAGDHQAAWGEIESEYMWARDVFRAAQASNARYPMLPPQQMFVQAFESLMLGTVARAHTKARCYTSNELEQDVALMESLLKKSHDENDRVSIKLGYGTNIRIPASDDRQLKRLNQIMLDLNRRHMQDHEYDTIAMLATRLSF